jgi:hypothetical protein
LYSPRRTCNPTTPVGPVYAKKLVRAFGGKVFDIIEAAPDRLREVDGVGPVRAASIVTAPSGAVPLGVPAGWPRWPRQPPEPRNDEVAMSILGQFGLWLLGLTIGGTLMAGLMSVRDKPLAWWEYAVFGTMALGAGVALAMAPMVPWG